VAMTHRRLCRRAGHALLAGWMGLVVTRLAAAAQADPRTLAVGLVAAPAVAGALAELEKREPQLLADQVRLCEIPAPPFQEAARADAYRRELEALGLRNVRIDAAGNVLGERPGRAARPHLVVGAHLDTVFDGETDVRVTRAGELLRGPGIGDNCRGLAVMLGVVRFLNDAGLDSHGRITFAGTVGEEGLGDLRGVRHLFEQELKGGIDRFVSIDGAGLGITHVAVGSYRYRVTYRGPGGHSFGAFGLANPIHALGRLIGRLSDFTVPAHPPTTFSVGRIGGGTSVNTIADEAWAEIDLRSTDPGALADLDRRFRRAVDEALAAENTRSGGIGRLRVELERVGTRPPGEVPADAPIVQTAVAITEALGLPVQLAAGSTDANLPISLKIPAITVGGGGFGFGAHSRGEIFDATNSSEGTKRAALLVLALAGIDR